MAGKESLKSSFIEIIKSKILSGVLKPGDRLKPERELAEELGMSRGSINQGILDLERMGFVTVVPRKGTFVAEYADKATPETLSAIMSYDTALLDSGLFKDFMDLRILIERECARLACLNLSKSAQEALERNTAAVLSSTWQNAVDALYSYHKCITEISGNGAYYMIFQSFEKMIRNLIREHYRNEDELKNSLPMYQKLTEAIERRDAYEADIAMHRILGHASEYMNVHLKKKQSSEK